jgi:hypothetical protein
MDASKQRKFLFLTKREWYWILGIWVVWMAIVFLKPESKPLSSEESLKFQNQTKCQAYKKAKQECATAGNINECIEIKTGSQPVFGDMACSESR